MMLVGLDQVQGAVRDDDATLRRTGQVLLRRGTTEEEPLTEVALQLRDDVELLRGLDPSATVSSLRLFARLTMARTIAALPAPAFG
jgi:nucleotidyltransferase/DNA polymerase involved in DNA repair